jgi:hypothetical protein
MTFASIHSAGLRAAACRRWRVSADVCKQPERRVPECSDCRGVHRGPLSFLFEFWGAPAFSFPGNSPGRAASPARPLFSTRRLA